MATVHSDFVCVGCGAAGPECGFYSSPRLARGHISRCVSCHCKRTVQRRRDRLEADRGNAAWIDGRKCKPKMSADEARERNREKSRRHYWKDPDKSRMKQRASFSRRFNDDQKASLIRSRKRAGGAGMTPEQIDQIFESQGCVCAICKSADPGSKNGWNLDHCHSTKRVRFILCAHCNRGLGAFRDSPELMRKAADVLEGWQEGQPDMPVPARMEG